MSREKMEYIKMMADFDEPYLIQMVALELGLTVAEVEDIAYSVELA